MPLLANRPSSTARLVLEQSLLSRTSGVVIRLEWMLQIRARLDGGTCIRSASGVQLQSRENGWMVVWCCGWVGASSVLLARPPVRPHIIRVVRRCPFLPTNSLLPPHARLLSNAARIVHLHIMCGIQLYLGCIGTLLFPVSSPSFGPKWNCNLNGTGCWDGVP